MANKPAQWSPYRRQMEDFERGLLLGTMDRLRQLGQAASVSRVADLLGVTRSFVSRRMGLLGIRTVPEPKRPDQKTAGREKAVKAARAALAKQRAALRSADALKAKATAPIPHEPPPEELQVEAPLTPATPMSPENTVPGVPGEVD
jgi:hypothetical protein